mgnify:CR=1 FL=1
MLQSGQIIELKDQIMLILALLKTFLEISERNFRMSMFFIEMKNFMKLISELELSWFCEFIED